MTDQAPRPQQPRAVAASMALITEVMERPLDPSYAEEADRRRAAGLPASTGFRTPLLIIAAIVIGFLLVTAALTLRVPATAATKARADLISQIRSRQATGDHRARQVADLRTQIDRLQSRALAGTGQTVASRVQAAEFAAGTVPAAGPGLQLTVDDAAQEAGAADGDANPRTSAQTGDGRVTSRDLQFLVNSLWESGAEAISVGGQRLTAQSAIRFAGQAILVDYRPLTRPYVITAIGDPDTMPAAFQRGEGGAYLRALQQQFHIRANLVVQDHLTVPGASSVRTRLATPDTSAPAAPSGGSPSEEQP
ncbi:MAG TPA: DUF881 domain-containing protein [Segeticoccus sp.]|uniref:DUF881 domain-containing protein n=1 Tax=Segeticoccus sp. TaxID=2706531 RepID=UPI002D802CD3|nr:DUF881 domain-containing protein [Segeticoccus sp.]HET8599619.1 DUF881 domain-containing protein [Segeticoccus sp.]